MKSMRTLTNTQRVSSTCVARGTTTVTIADTTVYSTTSAPTGSSRTARAVVTAAVLLSSSCSSSPSPGLVERPDRLPEPLARHPDAVAARSRHVHDPVQEAAPALRPVPVRMPARWDPGLRQHILHARRQLRCPEVPEPPPRRSRRQRRRASPACRDARALFHPAHPPPRHAARTARIMPNRPAGARCPFSLGLDAGFPTIRQLKLATSQFGFRGGIA